MSHTTVAVIGGGVVGAAVLYTLAHRGIDATLLEADNALAYGASGTNSGVLHTGFDSTPGELETALILRAATLRDRVLDALNIPVLRCGAELLPRTDTERTTVAKLAENAQRNGVSVHLRENDGALLVPGESVTDPVAYTVALADAAVRAGATVKTNAAVEGIDQDADGLTLHLADGERLTCLIAVNCAGLHADTIARLVGDDSFEIYPRKGEFFVFELPAGATLDRILLPVPTPRTKGVLVFPTSTARSSPDPLRWTRRTRTTGPYAPTPHVRSWTRPSHGFRPSTDSTPSPATRAFGRRAATSTTSSAPPPAVHASSTSPPSAQPD